MPDTTDSIVLILIDAMRPDGLRRSSTPFIDDLIRTGCSTLEARSIMPSITLPCITSLFHSSQPDKHGITTNRWTPTPEIPPSLFSVVRAEDRKTASICNWEELRDLSPVGSLDMAVYIDNSYDAGGAGDRTIAKIAADAIRQHRYSLTFVYLGHVDVAGHEHGYMSPEYIDAIHEADTSVGVVLEALSENTTTILLADHGGHDKGHGSDCDEDMLIPVILNGPTIPQGREITEPVTLLDIAPTVTCLLNIDSPAAWSGSPISLNMPCRSAEDSK